MNAYQRELIKINFDYWRYRNTYYEDIPLNESMKAGLKIIKNNGFLISFNPKSAKEWTNRIEKEIALFDFNRPNYHKLAEIFDLIQGWGGKMGKTPYVRPAKNPPRNNFEFWKLLYLSGCSFAQKKLPEESLTALLKINGIGKSFATKHMKFWGDLPILDTRISLILKGSDNWNNYKDFLSILDEFSSTWGCTIAEAERAIFAFSQAYFNNTDLYLKENNLTNKIDINIAQKLSIIWEKHTG